MDKKEPTMRKILKFLLNNTMVEFTSKEIEKSIKRTGISYHTSRLKAFIMDNKEVSDILQVRVAKKRESVFMCKAKAVDNPDEWAIKLQKDYLAWERGKSVKKAKPEIITKPKENKGEISLPVSFVYNSEKPVEIPINLKIKITVEIVNQS
ncbi:MAG: hypothetical protein PVG39_03680 [Desulfobacteraceae bacterium]|jgi:hypothetical protein